MRWRDIRFEKPTEADGDSSGRIVQLLDSGGLLAWPYDNTQGCVAWLPMSELRAFTPIPDPPEGWRFVQAGEAFDKRAKWYARSDAKWHLTMHKESYDPDFAYIVPINPPEPQYRPFANAKEFAPHRDRWIRTPGQDTARRVLHYSDRGVDGMAYSTLFRDRTFDDGSPCGVEVTP